MMLWIVVHCKRLNESYIVAVPSSALSKFKDITTMYYVLYLISITINLNK